MQQGVFENRAKQKLKAGELVLSMGISQMRTADAPMIAAACGFDAIYVDLEHSPVSMPEASQMCVSALAQGITPIARVVSQHPHDAARILDTGAQGVMVPHIQDTAGAAAIVQNCKFPPVGHRSAFGNGPTLGYRAVPQTEINSFLNDNVLLIAMLETPQAIEHADAIAALPGIDVVHIGSLDVSNEMGIPADYHHPRMRAVYEKVAMAARKHGKAMGVGGIRGDFEMQKYLLGIGVRYLTSGSDVSYLMTAARAEAKVLRGIKLG